jgi:diguanylate cyclase (GGDEF)-like protein
LKWWRTAVPLRMADVLGLSKRLSYLKRLSLKKIAIYAAIPVIYLVIPLFTAFHFSSRPFLLLFVFFSANILIIFLLVRHSVTVNSFLRHECEDIESRINLQAAQNAEIIRQNVSLTENIQRFASLKKAVEEITRELNPDSVCESLCSSAFALIGARRGTCLLYRVDNDAQCLRLHTAKKEDRKLIIKAKQGDIFDHWVRTHMKPLLIEDSAKDFRFDRERIKSLDNREVGSLISVPLISGGTFLGILRLDDPEPGRYNLDDLRFLRAICDLGGVALENAQLYSNTQEMAVHDGLTRLYTKGYFVELLSREVSRCLRAKQEFGLLMLDIDHFKEYNDTYGHSAGDIVLKAIAGKLSSFFKDRGGIICRFGGEEFCVILPAAGRSEVLEAAERVRESIAQETFVLRRKPTAITVSIGAAVFPLSADEETGLLMKADKAMYAAKQAGRNKVVAA